MNSATSKLKKKHIRLKHQKVKVFRANDPILAVFMWGVNHSINDLQHINIPVMLMPDDFRSFSKIKIDNHLFNKENLPSHFKIKEYCPLVFRTMRERFGIDDQDYRESLTRSEPIPFPGGNPGKSGAKFYFSSDKLFIIKTLNSEDVEQLLHFVKHYHPYVVERHGKTFLPQYLGMYRVTVDGVEHYLAISRNVFSNHLNIHRKYDLKGSTVDREASEKEREKDLPTLKDNDFLKDGGKIYIGEEAKEKLMETLTADGEFLTKMHLMDYSLLLGVTDCEKAEMEKTDMDDGSNGLEEEEVDSDESNPTTPPPDSPTLADLSHKYHGKIDIIPEIDIYAIPSHQDAPRREIYFLAVIDVLTHYGVKKQAAKAAKTVKYGSNVEGISTCEPDNYAKRFIEFISKAIE